MNPTTYSQPATLIHLASHPGPHRAQVLREEPGTTRGQQGDKKGTRVNNEDPDNEEEGARVYIKECVCVYVCRAKERCKENQ